VAGPDPVRWYNRSVLAVQFPSLFDTRPVPIGGDWPTMVAVLSQHAVRADKRRGPLWSPTIYRSGSRRANRHVDAVTAFVIDLDGDPLETITGTLAPYRWHAYTTHSHRDMSPRWHVVVPFDEPVAAWRWHNVWHAAHQWVGRGDATTSDPARIYYLPQHADGMPHATHTNNGRFLTVADLPAWTEPAAVRQVVRSDGKFAPSTVDLVDYRTARANDIPAAAAELLAEFRTLRAAGRL